MTKRWLSMTGALLLMAAVSAEAQYTTASDTRIRVQKDVYLSEGDVAFDANIDSDIAAARLAPEWYRPTGTTCSGVDMEEVRRASIDADLYDPQTMISPEQAKITALCVVPGHIGSGEMELNNGRTEYEIALIPSGKTTYTKVVIDARTGAVLSTKQFGGLRGLAGWVRESFEREQNRQP
jgi:uncharacterized membrane protein YkoI